MPTYEYECESCKHTFDVFQSIKDEPLKICPECGKTVRRVINGGTGIIFKGSGFYVTDRSGGKACQASPKGGTEKSPACEGCPAASASSSGGGSASASSKTASN